MKTAQHEVPSVNMLLPCMPAVPRSPAISRPADRGSRTDIVALLQEVSDATRMLVRSKPVEVMATACAAPLVMDADPDKIRGIMMGLLCNAARSIDRGRIAVILKREDDWIRLIVADNGRGMSRAQIDAVIATSAHEHDGGIGGPLPCGPEIRIAKDLVRGLQGSLSLSSKLGAGTIVEVRLPLEPRNPPAVI
jgi:signal transduction histidine kinase